MWLNKYLASISIYSFFNFYCFFAISGVSIFDIMIFRPRYIDTYRYRHLFPYRQHYSALDDIAVALWR